MTYSVRILKNIIDNSFPKKIHFYTDMMMDANYQYYTIFAELFFLSHTVFYKSLLFILLFLLQPYRSISKFKIF